ncbi:RNA polymerase sigma factor [Agreia sp. PsM10]|uniref:RNA polymerase sigma factor n=1 Tax=Agreia sp. PsM10 TaxID=3030533 RepID=UPI00263BDD7F|nr:RNA polymerase sigma factor [Agreia sp. PsM10]MDN4641454.1 RNA polymerase sigma factor [Agreia sp. PsM10]
MERSTYSQAQSSLASMFTAEPLRLRRRSISLGVHPSEADDVAQTVALRAWHSVNGVRATEYRPMCSWLDTIARNTVVDVVRQRSRRSEVELDDDEPSADDIEVDTELRDRLRRTLQAIQKLPETLRVPLLMSAIEGTSADDIASAMGISSANVRQRISRARRALAQASQAVDDATAP